MKNLLLLIIGIFCINFISGQNIYHYTGNFADTETSIKFDFTDLSVINNSKIVIMLSNITDYDGNNYNTVKIGKQTWMAENLKTIHYADGTPIVNGTEILVKHNPKVNYYFIYENTKSSIATYGLLYTWCAAMNNQESCNNIQSGVQGVCPNGWHLPSLNEFEELIDYLGDTVQAGCKLKSSGIEYWKSPNYGANNLSGFTALPAGGHYGEKSFIYQRIFACFWASTEDLSDDAYRLVLNRKKNYAYIRTFAKRTGYSVRCVKN
ncbi:MAG: hypothetical protein DRJ10_16945 [Bacteroidetes bacterium]|nr:MAG: hypothetical protein DRJ10_16945 [Bacteroidota bacterium]